MFLKKGVVPNTLYPGTGAEHVERLALGAPVNRLRVIMCGFNDGVNAVENAQRVVIDLSVLHVDGSDTAELHCKFLPGDAKSHHDNMWAQCNYVLIGEVLTKAPTPDESHRQLPRRIPVMNRLHRVIAVAVVFAAVLGVPAVASAQSATVVSGRVINESGVPIPNATVTFDASAARVPFTIELESSHHDTRRSCTSKRTSVA